MIPARQPQQEYIITDDILKSWNDVSPDHYIVKRIKQHARPHTSAPAPEPCAICPYVILCSECKCLDVAQQAARAATLATLDKLQAWRIRRMNGMLKKDVWKGWNEETDLIDSLRRTAQEQQR